ncbi:hypothetical protein [Lapillicoccus sp.]|uniref:hypothetical protein n=1 Tax=Lapillicoccus sp. TaxID=1909287 RepID=UPI003983A0A1
MRSEEVSGRWVHAHEEDTEDEMVFRPAGTHLPPSRGRRAFDLRPDGSFAEAGLGATDVPEQATGRWELTGDTITLSEGASQGVPREMDVVAADAGRLVVRKR